MKTIETIATISSSGSLQLANYENLPVGKFKVVLVIDESSFSPDADQTMSQVEDSFLAATADLVGSLVGLPADLSVNKNYLEKLGER